MRIDLRNPQRQWLFTVEVDPASPPTVVRARAGSDPAPGSAPAPGVTPGGSPGSGSRSLPENSPGMAGGMTPGTSPGSARDATPDGPPASGTGQAVHLNWDQAFDDEQHLRRCPACGCEDLYVRHEMPRLTAFVMIALAAVIAIVMLGLGRLTHALIVLGIVGLIDAGVYLFFSGKVMVCYRCRSEYRGMPIGRDARAWESSQEERYPPAAGQPSTVKGKGGTAA